jgi:hypothetical protein
MKNKWQHLPEDVLQSVHFRSKNDRGEQGFKQMGNVVFWLHVHEFLYTAQSQDTKEKTFV